MQILPTFDFTPPEPPELKNFALMLRKLYEQLARVINYNTFTGTFNDAATPAGVINGINTVFTLSSIPSPASSLLLFLNGILQTQGVDYTLVGATITYAVAPSIGDVQLAWYRS